MTRKDERSMSDSYLPASDSSGLAILPENVTMLRGFIKEAILFPLTGTSPAFSSFSVADVRYTLSEATLPRFVKVKFRGCSCDVGLIATTASSPLLSCRKAPT